MSTDTRASSSSPVITQQFEAVGSARVMVVDSDQSSRSILEVSLKRAGYEVAIASGGREALQEIAASQKLPAVVVISTELNGEDGYSLCAQLRADSRTAKLPVMLLARAEEDERSTLADVVGADELVAKPAFARDVAALVTLWISKRDERGGYVLGTDALPLPVTLRALLATQRAGQIQLGKRNFIAYRAGRVTHAETQGLSGVDALVRMLALSDGDYRVAFTAPPTPATLELPLRELVNGIFPRLQKWEELSQKSLPLGARYQLDFAALAKALPTIPDAVNDVVRLFDGQRDVRGVLFDSPLNETVTLEVANRLLQLGVVKPAEQAPDQIVPKLAPKMFEPRSTEAEERMSSLFGSDADLQDAIVTPAEPPVRMPDWYEPPKGSGLEGDQTEGWVQQQLSAFNIQSVVEPSEPAPAAPEVAEFSAGTGEVEPQVDPIKLEVLALTKTAPDAHARPTPPFNLEAHARASAPRPMPPTPAPSPVPSAAALEASFFEGDEDTDPSVQQVPAPIEETYVPGRQAVEPAAEARPASGGRWLAMMAGAAVLVALIGAATFMLSGDEPVYVPPPIAKPEVKLEAPAVTVPEVSVSDEQIKAALSDASKLYEDNRFGEAIAALEQILEVSPSNVQAWMLMSEARLDNEERAAAEEAAMTVLTLDPNHADAFLLLATMHIREGKKDVAYGEINRYLELEPNGPHADEAKRLLKR